MNWLAEAIGTRSSSHKAEMMNGGVYGLNERCCFICEEAKLGPARACACNITEARAHFTAGKAPGPFRGQNKGLIGRGPVAFRRQNEKKV